MSIDDFNNDLESNGSHYKTSIKNLQSLFDPKSLKNFINLFNNNINNLSIDLNTNLNSGLQINNLDKSNRISHYGINKLPPKNQKSLLSLCWEALHDKVLIILSISAFVSLILGLYQTFYQPPDYDDNGKPLPKIQWVDGVAILLAVLIVVIVGAINDYNKEKQFMKLNNKKEDRNIIVFRSNEKLFISIYDLLVGDLLYIETGDIIPADCILISGECSCDESSITGESKTIDKLTIEKSLSLYNNNNNNNNKENDELFDPFLISGSKLLSGQGKAIVICVGENSINGKLMMQLSNNDNDEVTPLQNRLNILADGISKYGFLASIVLFIILIIKFIIKISTSTIPIPTTEKLSKLINILITSITIVVVAIPEGLPLAVTLALAFATTRMTSDGNLVRVLKSCETMGGATTICSDKTGTLTINKMTVVKGLIGLNNLFDDTIDSNSSFDNFKNCSKNLINNLLKNILLNSTAFENHQNDLNNNNTNDDDDDDDNNYHNKKSFWNNLFSKNHHKYTPLSSNNDNDNLNLSKDDFVGSKTECALLSLVQNKFTKFDNSIPKVDSYRNIYENNIVRIIPFESSLKWSGIIYHDIDNNKFTFYIKGAAEIILSNCKYISDLNNNLIDLTDSNLNNLDNIRKSFANDALRAVSLAHYTFTDFEISKINDWNDISTDELIHYPLILDLIVGIQDPLRPGVKHAIDQCHLAGVDVRMVTGDNVLTAKAISKNCGILNDETVNDNSYFMEGPEFRKLSDNERLRIVPKLHILARSSPEDKRILVKTLKELGEVVAVTGDGTNDAPALKLADVGFSMGLSGTEVAREASDIVLMTDDFTSIVNAIKWGRTVAASIRKFVQFQLTVNFTAVILTFITSVSSKENSSVLTAVQLLWVNLIMDTLAALALATDKPDDDILNSKPEGRNSEMISTDMWKMILGMSFFQLVITLTLNFYGGYFFFGKSNDSLKIFEKMMLKSMTFNTFVWMQIFTLFVSRILNVPQELNEHSTLLERLSERNIGFFKHLTRNYWFIGIVSLISILQIIIMFYGGAAFSVTPQWISMWVAALGSGYAMIPCGILLRIIPDEWLLRVLPLNAIKKFIAFFEWFAFGCGLNLGGSSEDENDESFNDTNGNNNDNNQYSDNNEQYNNNNNDDGLNPNIVLSGTPSPLLESQNLGTTENHKMNRLAEVISSANTSTSSLNNFTKKSIKAFSKNIKPSHERLLDEEAGRISYTENNGESNN